MSQTSTDPGRKRPSSNTAITSWRRKRLPLGTPDRLVNTSSKDRTPGLAFGKRPASSAFAIGLASLATHTFLVPEERNQMSSSNIEARRRYSRPPVCA
jgi:hypothetical protein